MHPFSKHILLCGFFCLMLLSACNTSQQAAAANQIQSINVHTLTAVARLIWDQKTHTLTADVAAAGLAPNSTHPEHIHAGTCASNPMGPIVYPLEDLKANGNGIGSSITHINNVQQGILATGWYVNIHQGPTLATSAGAKPIACGNVVNKGASIQKQQLVLVQLKAL